MMWWWGDPWSAGHWVGLGFMGVFWIAVIVGLVLLIRHAASRSAASSKPDSGAGQVPPADAGASDKTLTGEPGSEALRILEERYARGDIDRDEFLQRKSDLSS